MKLVITIMFHARIGQDRVRVVFGIARNLEVYVLLGTSSLEKFIKGMLPAKRMIDAYVLQPVPILLVQEVSDDKQTIIKQTNEPDGSILALETKNKNNVVRVSRAITLQLMSGKPVLARSNGSGTIQVDSYTPFGQQNPYMADR